MVRAIVWKEFREQGLIALTLLVLGAGVLGIAAALADPPTPSAAPSDVLRYLGAGRLATLLLAVTAGMVCGGALFAAEREAGTMGFLDALPVSRWQLWRGKLAAGTALAVVQVGGLVGVAALFGLVGTTGWAVAVIVYSLLAFCWGLYGSTLARTTLGSVGVAIPAASLASFLFLLPIMIFFQAPGAAMPRADGAMIFLILMLATPIVGSALVFTRPDRDRAADDPTPTPRMHLPLAPELSGRLNAEPDEPPATPQFRSRIGFKALLWLSTRQLARPGLVMAAFALVFGLALLLPGTEPALMWPSLALAIGVLAGVLAFADEQSHGTARFWGESRLPIGRAWAVKLAVFAMFALGIAFLLALPSAVRAQFTSGPGDRTLSGVFRTLLFEEKNLGSQGWKYLLVPVAYGFAAGHLCGILFRKAVVATGVAGLVGGTAAALWLPSLLSGGVMHWQLWLPPIAALVVARLLIRAWTADRLATPQSLVTLTVGCAAVFLVLSIGLGYRAMEVPDVDDSEVDIQYVAGLVPFDQNDGGRGFRTAAEQFARAAAGAPSPGPAITPNATLSISARTRMEERAESAILNGIRSDDPALAAWLVQVYSPDPTPMRRDLTWHAQAAESARFPTGIYEHPTILGVVPGNATLENGRRMATVILAHGLQSQADGDPAAFVADLRTVLALGRNMRNGSIVAAVAIGSMVARAALAATDRWLEQLDGHPELLKDVADAFLVDDRALPTRLLPDGQVVPAEIPPRDLDRPFDPAPHLLAERYMIREYMKAPNQWLPDVLTPAGKDKAQAGPMTDLISFAWTVPWERERTRRLVGLGMSPSSRIENQRLIRGRPGASLLVIRSHSPTDLIEFDRYLRALRRAMVVKLAVRHFQATRGATPTTIDEIVRNGSLAVFPKDPYAPALFRFRISKNDVLSAPLRTGPGGMNTPPPPLTVPAGQVILWSVGPDGKDDGGKSSPLTPGMNVRVEDLVFLVPPPASKLP